MQSLKREREETPTSMSTDSSPATKHLKNNTDIAIPSTPTQTSTIDSGPMTIDQKAFLAEKMKNIKRIKSAFWYNGPVDYVALNMPLYPTIIKQPIDLSLIEHKLRDNEYASVDDLVADVELLASNAFVFNGIKHAASTSASTLLTYFRRQMHTCPTNNTAKTSRANTPTIPPSTSTSLQTKSQTPPVPNISPDNTLDNETAKLERLIKDSQEKLARIAREKTLKAEIADMTSQKRELHVQLCRLREQAEVLQKQIDGNHAEHRDLVEKLIRANDELRGLRS